MKKIKNKGFSLIELLIVITIIGVLATIILTNISNARAKAYNAQIKQQFASFRTAAEIYYNNQTPNSYGPASTDCNSGLFSDNSNTNGHPASFIDPGNLPDSTQVMCGSTNTSYAVKATMFSGNEYFCVDSKGAAEVVSGTIGASATICP